MEDRASIVRRVRDAGGLAFVSISTITLAELRYGLGIMPESRKKAAAVSSLGRILDSDVDTRPFTASAANVYSEAGATLRKAGIAFSFQDLAIAAIAISENKTLASNDDFFGHMRSLCGLRFERWEP
ncbi:MAG: PIN domain-containing protein [Rubrobacter sp.]|nr:PIN domain-containing protein [Rubrobacter sp.]